MVGQGTASALTAEGLSELSRASVESNQRAVALFERALSIDRESASAHVGLARAHVQRTDDLGLGDSSLDQAVEAGRRAIELDPSLGEAYVALGRAYRTKGWLREELELWQRRARLEPSDPNANEKVGWLLWFTGRADESVPWLQTALALRPDGRWTSFFLGNANLARGDFEDSTRRYAAALERYPNHSSAQAGVIWSLLAAHRDEEARSQLRRFQRGTFDVDRYPLKLADIEHFLGETDSATMHAQQALAEPDERYWPRGILASTILGALLWPLDHPGAAEQLARSDQIDRRRLEGGDQGYMPHVDLAAVAAIRGDARIACGSLRAAIAAGWCYPSLAARDPLFERVRSDEEFGSLVGA